MNDHIIALERAERQVRLSERRLLHVVEHVREVFFETDLSGRWTFLNAAWTFITGFSVQESVGRAFSEFVWADDVELATARFNTLIGGNREYSRYDIRCRTKGGRCRWVEVHLQLVADEENQIVGTSGTLRDVTAQRELSEQLVRAREAAITASMAKSEFLANMSHEIRTPMNGILGLTDLLLDANLAPDQQEYATGIKESAEALLGIINDILDFSKIEAGRLSITPVTTDLRQVVREAVSLLDVRARKKGLNVSVELASSLPHKVNADPVRIRQVLINLVDNAVKFTHAGSVTISVAPERRTDRELIVHLAVSDTGIGIECDKLDVVFDKFTQADASTTRRYGGSGLGLAICRQLVELMGGEIGVASEPGRGSTFWFRIPLAPVETVVEPRERVQEPGGRPDAASRRYKVLVVEDSAINRTVAARTLEKLGCDVDVAENGAIAIELVRTTGYDVVFMDCQMPIVDGYEATAAIRRLPARSETRIAAMTAHAMAGDRERCIAAGMDDYISKPIHADEIRRVLSEVRPSHLAPVSSRAESRETAAPPREPASFDRARLWSRMDGDRQAVSEIVDLLAVDGPAYMRALVDAIEAGDLAKAAGVAHTLRGSVSHFGADGAFELARQVETAARNGTLTSASDSTRRLEGELTRLVAELKDWMRTLRAQSAEAEDQPVSR